jgi:hypothetical protein
MDEDGSAFRLEHRDSRASGELLDVYEKTTQGEFQLRRG